MNGNIIRMGSEKKGFGFILGEDHKDYFFHITSLVRCSWKDLGEGDAVVFIPKTINGKLKATYVEKYFVETKDKISDNSKRENTYAGIHPMVNLNSFDSEERNIIKTLGKTFYVTNGGIKISLGATSEIGRAHV